MTSSISSQLMFSTARHSNTATMSLRCVSPSWVVIVTCAVMGMLLFPRVASFVSPALPTRRVSTRLYDAGSDGTKPLKLNVAIVGAGPSGLLLAHFLLQQGHSVVIMERRNDVRQLLEAGSDSSRAYALGIGIRGRTAIRTAGEALWQAIQQEGYPSERFDLHINSKIRIRLRDGAKKKRKKNAIMEPSLLLYQTDLCAALLGQLEERYSGKKCSIKFNSIVERVDSESNCCFVREGSNSEKKQQRLGPFQVIVGCDGVNSVVRNSIQHEAFEQVVKLLPGQFKVCRCATMPPKLDPTSVALLLPKKGSTTAFVEPTRNGESCILFAGRQNKDSILSWNATKNGDPKDLGLLERFPLLEGIDEAAVVAQLSQQEPSRASSVQCNAYHYKNMVLCGDAAHATGGVSGQGVNSALVDASVLAKCLDPQELGRQQQQETGSTNAEVVQKALLSYSQSQVPEGKALYDLSFGDEGQSSVTSRIRSIFSTLRDTIFQGKFGIGRPPLQTLLTTSLTPFADIRRERDGQFSNKFPSAATWNDGLENLYNN